MLDKGNILGHFIARRWLRVRSSRTRRPTIQKQASIDIPRRSSSNGLLYLRGVAFRFCRLYNRAFSAAMLLLAFLFSTLLFLIFGQVVDACDLVSIASGWLQRLR